MCARRAHASSIRWWKGLRRASKGSRSKPAFSHSWLIDPPSEQLLDTRENRFVRTSLYRSGNGSSYFISPYEYNMPEEETSMVLSVMKELNEEPPPQAILDDEIALRSYVESNSSGLLKGTVKGDDVDLPALLGRITAQYTCGYGTIEHLLRDERVQDLYIDSPPMSKPVYVSLGGHIPKGLEGTYATNLHLTERELRRIVSVLRYHSGLPFSEASPVLECDLRQYNARVTAVGPPLSSRGISIAIRKHSHDPWTLLRLIDVGAITSTAAAFLSMSIAGRRTMLIAGPRGAGKTSLLGSLLFEVDRSQRIIVIEDTPELPVAPLNEYGYKVMGLNVGSSTETSADRALRTALRLGESVLVLGEVRGPETRTLYEMMSAGTAGSSVLGTFHADSAKAVYKRAVEDLGVSKVSFTATDLVVVAGLVQPKGRRVRYRRVIQIAEVMKDGPPGGFRDLFIYDPQENSLKPTNELPSSGTLVSIASLWGMTPNDVLGELKVRASVLDRASVLLGPERAARPGMMPLVSEAFQVAREKAISKGRYPDVSFILKKWEEAFNGGAE
ncbi:MAG: type II/IV secretion system ATPase subunit [Candidatus Thermoplasmatota archaeon]|nr:type II/IV secretion system ATPase subunit [Candidatus Thermoplasmatota archaeon]